MPEPTGSAKPLGLKSCPFCGGEAVLCDGPFEDEERFFVACRGKACFAAVGEGYDQDGLPDHKFHEREAAAAAWNRRVEPVVSAKPLGYVVRRSDGSCVDADHLQLIVDSFSPLDNYTVWPIGGGAGEPVTSEVGRLRARVQTLEDAVTNADSDLSWALARYLPHYDVAERERVRATIAKLRALSTSPGTHPRRETL